MNNKYYINLLRFIMDIITMEDPNYDEVRDKFFNMMENSKDIQLTYNQIKNLEIGIFNWCIDFSNNKYIVKNWENPQFKRIYINKCVSVLNNLNSSGLIKNDYLYSMVNKSLIKPENIPYMRPEELFPSIWEDEIEFIKKKNEINNTNENISYTDQFRCGKCKERKCTYYEAFLRSADEPAVVFVECINCGNEWKC